MPETYNLYNLEAPFEEYLDAGNQKAVSIKNYLSDFRHFAGWMMSTGEETSPLRGSINHKTISEYKSYLESNKIPHKTINRRLSTIRKFCSFCISQGWMKENPAKKITNINPPVGGQITNLVSDNKASESPRLIKKIEHWFRSGLGKKKIEDGKIPTSNIQSPNSLPGLSSNFGLQHYIGFVIILIFMSVMGAGIYNQFFVKNQASLAYPTAPTKAGRILSFQGRLTDTLSNPITTATNVVFQLYSVSSGGVALYNTGTCSVTPDQDGIFSTLIGSDCGAEITASVFTENANVYLGVTVGGDAEMTPRQQIANVGYAINSETLQGLPPGTGTSVIPYINVDGNLLISASAPGIRSTSTSTDFTLSSAKATVIQSAGTGDIVLQATESGTLKFRTGGITDAYTRIAVDNLGNVGIGTTAPAQKLDVAGTAQMTGFKMTTSPSAGYILTSDATGVGSWADVSSTAGPWTLSGINLYPDSTAYNVGIGTTAPGAYKLNVNGNSNVTGTLNVTTSVSSPTFQGIGAAVTFGNASYGTTIAGSGLTVSPTAWTATPTISGLTTMTSGFASNAPSTITANTLTSNNALAISSTATGLTTGGLLSLDWSPGSALTATGDLLSLNIGTNGNIGNLFNVKDTGSSLFSVSETAVTSNLPTSFTSSGDVSIAYDLNFTNPTASYIKSSAPFYIQAGETFGSSDLTLQTYNSGDVVIDSPGGVTLNQAQAWDLADSSTTSLNIESGLMNFDTTNSRVGIGTTSPLAKLHVEGSCVTGDTLLPIRRKKKRRKSKEFSGDGDEDDDEFDYLLCRIDEIQPGDEVLSLNEFTEALEYARINKLMDMGVKPIFRLTTEDGRTIRTTGNHPYLVQQKESSSINQSDSGFSQNSQSTSQISTGLDRHQKGQNDLNNFTFAHLSNQDNNNSMTFADTKAENVTKTSVKAQQDLFLLASETENGIVISPRKSSFSDSQNIKTVFAQTQNNIGVDTLISQDVEDHSLSGADFQNFLFSQDSAGEAESNFDIGNRDSIILSGNIRKTVSSLQKIQNIGNGNSCTFNTGLAEPDGLLNNNSRGRGSFNKIIHENDYNNSTDKMSSSRWTKVIYIKIGDEIAVQNGETIAWQKIKSIEELPAEQVYDIEVEGTHNFVGNGIVAHNTYIMSGNVGIGTTAPANKLDVAGTAQMTGFKMTTSPSAGYILTSDAVGVGSWTDVSSTAGPWTLAGVNLYPDSTSYNVGIGTTSPGAGTKLAVMGGNVGIGTTNPGHKLTVEGNGDSNTGVFAIDVTGSGSWKWASAAIAPSLAAGNNVISMIGQAETSKNAGYIGFNYQGAGSNSNFLTFGLFAVDNVLNITGGGNVGIGTTAPANKLDVAGTAQMTGFKMTTSPSAGYILTSDATGVGSWADVSSTAGPWTLSGVNLYPDSTSYNVGIGTTAPLSKLGVLGNLSVGATYGAIAAPTSGAVIEGNVGIGTTAPLQKLHVEGQCVAMGTLIRRRKKKKRGDGDEDEWEDVPVEDIKPGDEVLTLNEESGGFEWQEVEEIMDMGIQEAYELITESGKKIETTANHPYLTRGFPGVVELDSNSNEGPRNQNQSGGDLSAGNYSYKFIVIHNESLSKTTANNMKNIANKNDFVNKKISTFGIKGVPNNSKIQAAAMFPDIPEAVLNTEGFIFSTLLENNLGVNGVWKKVSYLKVGDKIATLDGFEKITSIKITKRQQMYDLQIANTHNFVAGHYVDKKIGKTLKPEEEKALISYLATGGSFFREFSQKDEKEQNSNQSQSQTNVHFGSKVSKINHKVSKSSSILTANNINNIPITNDTVNTQKFLTVNGRKSVPEPILTKTVEKILSWADRNSTFGNIEISVEDFKNLVNRYKKGEIMYGGIVAHNTYISGNVGIGTTGPGEKLQIVGGRLRLPQTNEPATPTLNFGDGNTGFYEGVDDSLRVSIGGTLSWMFDSTYFGYASSFYPVMMREAGSATNPVYSFYADADTGMASGVENELSLIAGGTNVMHIKSGNVGIGTTGPGGRLQINTGAATIVGQIIKAAGSQSANLAEYQDSSGNVLAGVDERGVIFSDAGSTIYNFFAGVNAGSTTASGNHNIAIGNAALQNLTTGQGNIMLGSSAGAYITTGDGNFGLGNSALSTLTTGGYNVAIGALALYSLNTSSSSNVAIGSGALRYATTAEKNTSIGMNSGLSLTTGDSNIFIGYHAAYYQTTNSNLLIIDNQIRADAATEETNAILYGTMAAAPADQTLRVNGEVNIMSGNVGIGTTAPANKLDVAGTAQMTGFKMTTSPSAGYILTSDATGVGSWADVSSTAGPWTLSGVNLYPDSTSYNVGIGTTSPLSKLGVLGNLSVGATYGAIAAPTSGAIFEGNVGIGTTGPAQKLHVYGNGAASQILVDTSSGSYDPSIALTTAGATTEGLKLWYDANVGDVYFDSVYNSTAGDIHFRTKTAGTPVEALFIESAGNVGIGTTAPSSLLEIKAATPILTINGTTANSLRGINWTVDGSDLGAFIKVNSTTGEMRQSMGPSVAWGGFQSFYTDTTEKMRITSAGNVGIGTTAPGAKLDVYRDSAGTGNRWQWNATNNVNTLDLTMSNGNGVMPNANSAYLSYLGSAADFGIRTTTSGAANFVITSTGNVGIGTTAPGSALDVKGTLRLSGSTSGYVGLAPAAAAGSTTYTLPSADGTSGQVLSTSGAGVLSWATGGGSSVWSALTAPTANLTLAHAGYTTTMGWTATGALDPWTFNLTNNAGAATAQRFINITNALTSQTVDVNTEALLRLDNADTSAAGSTIVNDAILITNTGGITSGVTDAIDASATEIVNALNVGPNIILGTTAAIDFTNFDVSTAGVVTAGTYNSQTISSAASFTGTVTVATSVSSPIFQGNAAAVTFGNASYGTTIAGSGLTVGPTAWTATPTISGLITATSGLTANGALTANAAFTLGDNGDLGSVNTSSWDVSTAGAASGFTGISSSGNIDLSSLSAGGMVKAAVTTGRLSITTGGTDYEYPLTFSNGLTRTVNAVKLGGTLTAATDIPLGGYNLTFSGTGNVGIGTTGPGQKLDIFDGGIYLTGTNIAHGMTDLAATNAYGYLRINANDNGGFRINGYSDDASTSGLQFLGTIGVTDPTDTTPAMSFYAAKKSGTGDAAIGSSETAFQFQNRGDAVVTILGSGNVGIGTTGPSAKLVSNVNAVGTVTGLILNNQYGYGVGAGTAATRLAFGRDNSGTGQTIIGGAIDSGNENETTSNPQYMAFSTKSGTTPFNLTERVRITSTGNVGIGTTSPGTKLELGSGQISVPLGSAGAPSYSFSGDLNTGIYSSSADALAFAAGSAELAFLDSGSFRTGASGVRPAMKIGASTAALPGFFFTTDTDTGLHGDGANSISLVSAGSAVLTAINGNVGIGTTGPAYKLDVNGSVRGDIYYDSSSVSYYLDPANSGTSLNTAGDVVIAAGAGKLDVGTVDPPYTINDKKYATYLPSMTGIKEETTGKITLNIKDVDTKTYYQTIDFNNQPDGSDLWLFSKTTNLKNNINDLTVLLSNSSNSKVWYKVDETNFKLTFFSNSPTEVSYRLTAPRFDSEKWTNIRDQNDPVVGFVINDQGNVASSSPQLSLNKAKLSDQSDFIYNGNLDDFKQSNLLFNLTGDFIEEFISINEALIAKIKTGFIEAENIIVNNTLIAKIINSEKIVSPIVETENIIATGTAQLNSIATNEIKPQSGDLTIDLSSPVIPSPDRSRGQAPEGIQESLDSRFRGNDNGVEKGTLARLIIKGLEGKSAVVIDAAGNASFSGQIIADSLQINTDATVAGNLVASDAQFNNVTMKQLNNEGDASISGKLIAGEIESSTINDIQALLADIKNQPIPDPNYYQNLDSSVIPVETGIQESLDSLLRGNDVFDSLTVTGQSNLYNVSVSNSLLVGTTLFDQNSIISLASELKLSALAKINLFDGAVIIAKDGKITTRGEIIAKGGIRTDEIKPLTDDGQVSIKNLTINNLTIDKISTNSAIIAAPDNFAQNGIFAPAIEAATASAGLGILPANQSEVIIYNDRVSADSLVYLTPTSDAPTNSSLTVGEKSTGAKPYFKVISQPSTVPVKFNWLIVN